MARKAAHNWSFKFILVEAWSLSITAILGAGWTKPWTKLKENPGKRQNHQRFLLGQNPGQNPGQNLSRLAVLVQIS